MILNQFLSWRRRSWRLVPSGSGEDVDDRRASAPLAMQVREAHR
jgi:hypothetical protein